MTWKVIITYKEGLEINNIEYATSKEAIHEIAQILKENAEEYNLFHSKSLLKHIETISLQNTVNNETISIQ